MAYKAPGKHYREGMSLVEVIRQFPNDAAAEQFGSPRFAGRMALTARRMRLGERPGRHQTQDHALPLPRLPQVVLGQDRDRHAIVEAGIAGVSHGDLPAEALA